MYLGGQSALLEREVACRDIHPEEIVMSAYLDRIASVLHREPHHRAVRVPRRLRPRRARATFVAVDRSPAYAY
jgi:hypothetical protein